MYTEEEPFSPMVKPRKPKKQLNNVEAVNKALHFAWSKKAELLEQIRSQERELKELGSVQSMQERYAQAGREAAFFIIYIYKCFFWNVF